VKLKFSSEEVKTILCHFLWSSKRSMLVSSAELDDLGLRNPPKGVRIRVLDPQLRERVGNLVFPAAGTLLHADVSRRPGQMRRLGTVHRNPHLRREDFASVLPCFEF
jgi:hypothetical protein